MLSRNLRKILDERDLSVAKLARETEVPRSTISQWLNNESNPDLNQLDKVARYLNISIEALAFGRAEKHTIEDFLSETEIHSGLYRIKISKVSKD